MKIKNRISFNSDVTAIDFPFRNWLAGRSIARNIIDSIEKSRKTVLVLSNAFARSYWCELEMSMAQHKTSDHSQVNIAMNN